MTFFLKKLWYSVKELFESITSMALMCHFVADISSFILKQNVPFFLIFSYNPIVDIPITIFYCFTCSNRSVSMTANNGLKYSYKGGFDLIKDPQSDRSTQVVDDQMRELSQIYISQGELLEFWRSTVHEHLRKIGEWVRLRLMRFHSKLQFITIGHVTYVWSYGLALTLVCLSLCD